MVKAKNLPKIKINFIGFFKKEEVVEAEKEESYLKILEKLGINPETVVVLRNGQPVPVDEEVEEGEITVMRVISGG